MIKKLCILGKELEKSPKELRSKAEKIVAIKTKREAFNELQKMGFNSSSSTILTHRKKKCACFKNEKLDEEWKQSRLSPVGLREVKILIIDIERTPGIFEWKNWRGSNFIDENGGEKKVGGLTISGNLWSRYDYRHTFGVIPTEAITLQPETVCASYAWVGSKEIHFTSVWKDGKKGFAKKLWEVYNEADIVVGHNLKAFDDKHIKTLLAEQGLTPPSPYKVIDTLLVLRRQFNLMSNTLDDACQHFGLPAKTDHLNMDFLLKIRDRNPEALKRVESYNEGDILATYELYLKELPWIPNHPNVAPFAGVDDIVCQRCASTKMKRASYYQPSVLIYREWVCEDCGGYTRETTQLRGTKMKNI